MPRSSGQMAMPSRAMRLRGQADGLRALEDDRAGALADHAHDRLQRRRLAGAVAAEQRHHLAAATTKSTPCRMCDSPYQACRPATSSIGRRAWRAGRRGPPASGIGGPHVRLDHRGFFETGA